MIGRTWWRLEEKKDREWVVIRNSRSEAAGVRRGFRYASKYRHFRLLNPDGLMVYEWQPTHATGHRVDPPQDVQATPTPEVRVPPLCATCGKRRTRRGRPDCDKCNTTTHEARLLELQAQWLAQQEAREAKINLARRPEYVPPDRDLVVVRNPFDWRREDTFQVVFDGR